MDRYPLGTGDGTHRLTNLVIRPFKAADVDAICVIETHTQHARWTRTAIEQEVSTKSSSLILTAILPDKSNSAPERAVGYVCFRILWEDIYILKVGVHPDFRGRGIGTELMRHAERRGRTEGASRAVLEVADSNIPAVNLYRKLGFEFAKKDHRYSDNPAVMVKFL